VLNRPLASVVAGAPPGAVMVTSWSGAPVCASLTVPNTVTTGAVPELLLLLRTLLLPVLALLLPGPAVLACPPLLLPAPLLPDLLLLLLLVPLLDAALLLPSPPLLLLLSLLVPPMHADKRTRLDTAVDRSRRMVCSQVLEVERNGDAALPSSHPPALLRVTTAAAITQGRGTGLM
jgi:hypothetical protein